ncbi:MAG: KAP family NTPase, partial [Alphaproteobacteria bacterium]|nr:KAP family NTPase [Alphaproteobacteria bacterium]
KIVYFSSWEYERADMFTSLLKKITEGPKLNKKLLKSISRFTFDMALRHVSGMSFKDVENHFGELYEGIKTIREKLNKEINKDVILFIDDLDRCSSDNILTMLESIKWFLKLDHVLVVIAVDMDKIAKAWKLRYGDDDAKEAGRDHTEKMFQMQLPIPSKSQSNLMSFVRHLPSMSTGCDVEYFVNSMPANPRKLKLGFNLLQYTLYGIKKKDLKNTIGPNYMRTLITWIAIQSHHQEIAEIAKSDPDCLVEAAAICSQAGNYLTLRNSLQKYLNRDNSDSSYPFQLHDHLKFSFELTKYPTLKICEICTDKDKASFKTLKQYGDIFQINLAGFKNTDIITRNDLPMLNDFVDIFKNVIDEMS